ncbi:hypothetical protein CORC01_06804 [Colletotrichum orchidophilum]|uniref:Uncharacterized protein n=1 Tax=Colletotrichum orchidophilum TaxID=1209926 RepID=A0A1G4B972_9PEZI|nr:uncharacterized protein CORC01_06804 [Colletotrichum orchidophilum]OHE97941.1 hypothetical protein CORC01_06804 [Colletotrichum orchidophilum]
MRNENLFTVDQGTQQKRVSLRAAKKRKPADDGPELLDAKRLRLLQKGDWAGINVQKSLPIHFSGGGSSDRRQIWGFRNKYSKGQSSPFWEQDGSSRRPLQGKAMSYSSTQGGDRDVRIRIGSEDIRYGGGSQTTKRSSRIRPLPTVTQSSNLRRSEYFQQPSSRNVAKSPDPAESRSTGRLLVYRTKSSRQRRHGQSAASHGNTPSSSGPSKSPSHPSRLDRLQEEGRSMFVESSPSIIYHPVPQRFSQLVLRKRSGTPKSDLFGSTVGQVGLNLLQDVASRERSENERWHRMVASDDDQPDTASAQDLGGNGTIVDISPGVSNMLHSSGSVARGPRFDHSPMSTSTDPPCDNTARNNMHTNQSKNFSLRCENDGKPRNSIEKIRLSSSPLPIWSSALSADLTKDDLYHDNDELPRDSILARIEACSDGRRDTVTRQLPPMFESDSEEEMTHNQNERNLNEQSTRPPDTEHEDAGKPMFIPQILETDVNHVAPVLYSAKADMNLEWMSFIFGEDVDDNEDTTFQEACQEAARDLRPSSSSASNHFQSSTVPISTLVPEESITYGTLHHQDDDDVISTPPKSPKFRIGQTDMAVRRDRADFLPEYSRHEDTHTDIADTIRAEDSDSIIPQAGTESLASDIASTPVMDSASMIAQPSDSDMSGNASQPFQFAKPKTFVGRLVSSSTRDPGPVLHLSIHDKPKKRGRPKGKSRMKKAKDGRANIRGLPDYDGDPIEGGSDE